MKDYLNEDETPSSYSDLSPGRESSAEDLKFSTPKRVEVDSTGVEKYIISKHISKMDEPTHLTNDELLEKKIVFPDSPNRNAVNTFRSLRTKLIERSAGNNFTIVVSSAKRGGGASHVAVNLAAAFAFDNSKTSVIVDCNLREPSIHRMLGLTPEHGLTDFLESPDMDIASIIYPSGVKRLRIVPAGMRKESSAEFFTSFRMKQFLTAVRKRYPDRFVVIDAPPIEDSPDSKILSDLCDYTLLVVPKAKMTESQIVESSKIFNSEKFLGVVING